MNTVSLLTVFESGEQLNGHGEEPDINVVFAEYAAEDYAKIRAEADLYQIKVITVEDIETFAGPFTGMRSRVHEESSFRDIADEQIVVKDGHFFGVKMVNDYHTKYDKEKEYQYFTSLYLMRDGKTRKIKYYIETTLYGHDGEEDSYTIDEYAVLEKRIKDGE